MSGWDGEGVPPAAEARLTRARRSPVRSSLLAVPSQAGLDACGFASVGEVMGSFVEYIGWRGYANCGYYGAYGTPGPFGTPGGFAVFGAPVATVTSGTGGVFGFAPFVDALNAGWDGAIGRMLSEAAALGGDGVVGVQLTERHLEGGVREFTALGTAVRSVGAVRAARLFATELSGSDVAKLVHAGWIPAGVIVAIAAGIRHDDYQTLMAAQLLASNVEVPGYTELVTHVRADARRVLADKSRALGADGAILTAPLNVRVHEIEVGENHRDHVAEATLTATAVARFEHATAEAFIPVVLLD
jgi:uncharacterized protein YbjQ (UPF0145 family)